MKTEKTGTGNITQKIALDIIKKYKKIIKINKKNIILFAYHQGKVLKKFKANRSLVEQF